MKHRDRGQYINPLKRTVSNTEDASSSPHFLVHVTSVGAARAIVADGKIETTYCRHFKKPLVYFFVDRVGYRPPGSDTKSDQINRFPFVFIIQLNRNDSFFHAYPFDTGAALDGMFDEKADPFVFIEDYELNPTAEGVFAHIAWAFDSNLDYFKGHLNSEKKHTLNPWQSVERSYFDIAQLASPTHNRPDNRASAIEVALDMSLTVHKTGTYVIFPKQLIENGPNSNVPLTQLLLDRGISWQTYNWLPNSRPVDFFQEISHVMETFIRNTQND